MSIPHINHALENITTACQISAFCGAERTPMRFRADAMRNITDAPKRSKNVT